MDDATNALYVWRVDAVSGDMIRHVDAKLMPSPGPRHISVRRHVAVRRALGLRSYAEALDVGIPHLTWMEKHR